MENNPYNAPIANSFSGSTAYGSVAVTPGVLDALRGTKGWVKLFGVLLILGGILMIIGSIFAGIAMFMGASTMAQLGTEGGAPAEMIFGSSVFATITAGLYLILGICYLYPGKKLWNYGTSIDRLLTDSSSVTLEAALHHQRRFWKFIGILTIASFILGILLAIGAIAFGAMAASSFSNL